MNWTKLETYRVGIFNGQRSARDQLVYNITLETNLGMCIAYNMLENYSVKFDENLTDCSFSRCQKSVESS